MKRFLSLLLVLTMLCGFGTAFAAEEAPAEELPAEEIIEAVPEESPAEETPAEEAPEAAPETPAEEPAAETPVEEISGAEAAAAPVTDGAEAGTRENPIPLTPGASYTAAIKNIGDVVWYSFTPTTSGLYKILATAGRETDSYVSLYDAEDTSDSLEENDDGGKDYNFMLASCLTAGKTYLYKVSICDDDSTGEIPFTFTSHTIQTLTPGTSYTDDLNGAGTYQFTPDHDGTYVIWSTSDWADTYVELYNAADTNNCLADDDDGGEEYNFRLSYTLEARKTYLYKVSFFDDDDEGEIPFGFIEDTVTPLTPGSACTVNILKGQGSVRYSFTPQDGGTYVIWSADNDNDTYVQLYDADDNRLASDDDSGYDENFRLSYTLEAGKEYQYAVSFADEDDYGELSFRFGKAYTLTYNANKGTGAPKPLTGADGETVTLSDKSPTRTGWTFLGWAETADAKEAKYRSDDDYTITGDTTLYAVWEATDLSGSCGASITDNVIWAYNSSTHTLTISGTGAMADYTSDAPAPFATFSDDVTNIVIESGVTTVGRCAFYNYTALTSVSIPATVTAVHTEAFNFCTSLTTAKYYDRTSGTPEISNADLGNDPLVNLTPTYCYTVVLDPNGGTGKAVTADKIAGQPLDLSDYTAARARYTFKGWAATADTKETLTSYTADESTTLYAVWEPDACSGYCGAEGDGTNAYWSLDTTTGMLTIGGTGAVASYSTDTGAPWDTYASLITGVTIGSGITAIGNDAFKGLISPTTTGVYITDLAAWCGISFGNSYSNPLCKASDLYLNGEKAASLSIPDTVTSIGAYAFYSCSTVESITIPACVTAIGKNAFYQCSYLKNVYITDLAAWCGISFGNENANPLSYNTDSKLYLNNKAATALTIPSGVTAIGSCAFFNYKALTSVSIPRSVTTIGDSAFYNCGLTAVTVPDSVTSMGASAFSHCTHLTTASIPCDIGEYVFANCSELTTLYLFSGVTNIANHAFKGCDELATVYSINEKTAVTIGTDNGNLDTDSIWHCPYIISYDTGCDDITFTAGTANYGGTVTFPTMPAREGYTFLGWSMTRGAVKEDYTDRASYTIDDSTPAHGFTLYAVWRADTYSVTYDGNGGDDTVTGVPAGQTKTYGEELTLRGTVPVREGYTFLGWAANDSGAAKADYQPGADYTANAAVTLYAVWEKTVTYTVTFDANGGDADSVPDPQQKTKGTNLTLSTTVPTRSGHTFLGWAIEGSTTASYSAGGLYTADADITLYAVWRADSYSVTYNANGGNADSVPKAQTKIAGEALTLRGTAPTRDGYVFLGWATYSTAAEAGYAAGGEYTLDADVTLYAVWLPLSGTCGDDLTWQFDLDTGTLTIRGTGDMYDFTRRSTPDRSRENNAPWAIAVPYIKNVVIESGAAGIGKYAFYDCSALQSVSIPDTVTYIGEGAFSYCVALQSAVIPDSVTSLGAQAFSACTSLTDVTVGEGVTALSDDIFLFCTNLANVTLPSTLTEIGRESFGYCAALKTIELPSGVKTIGDGAFALCTSLETLTVPNSVTDIGKMAFYRCSSLTDITLPIAVTKIKEGTFQSCTALTNITVPARVRSIGTCAFAYCTSLTSVSLPSVLRSIGPAAFLDCSSLTYITLPEGVRSIGDEAFGYCTALAGISLPSTLTEIGNYAFLGCKALTDITIPEGVASISKQTFEDCESLTKVTLPLSVTYIGANAFLKCKKLADVYYDGTEDDRDDIVIPVDGNNSVLYDATWHYATYTVTYDANGGTGAPAAQTQDLGGTVTLSDTKPTRENYAFLGWAEKATAKEAQYAAGGEYTGSASVILHAVWLQVAGECGEDLTWSLDLDTGVLTISGTGDMTDYTGNAPWFPCCSRITSVVIEDGAAHIGDYAFWGCQNLTSVQIPAGVTSIGDMAFATCSSLQTITLPATVTDLGSGAFAVSGLTSFTVPAGVQSLGSNLFNGSDLQSIRIPAGVQTISTSALSGASALKDVYYCGTETQWAALSAKVPSDCTVRYDAHQWNSGEITTEPTCGKEGVKTYTCTVCGKTKTETVAATGLHTPVTDEAVAPTCTDTGLTEGSHCSVCGTVIVKQETVPAAGHKWNSGETTKAATCTEDGVKTYTCTVCKATKTETITAAGHTPVTDEAVAPTCAKAGLTEGSHCSVCGTVLKAQEPVPATGDHTWNSGEVTKAAACTTDGVKTYTCTVCGKIKTEAIPAAGHTPVTDKAIAPTCVDSGLTEGSRCSVCGTVLKAREIVPATGVHTWDAGVITTEPTTSSEGVRTYTCTVCGKTYTETIACLPVAYEGTGWTWSDGSFYYFDNSAMVSSAWVLYNGTWYYLDDTGAMATGVVDVPGDAAYYFSDGGKMQTSTWIWQDGKFYYFGSDGRMVRSNWLWYSGSWYYFDAAGAMVTGTYTVPGDTTFYFGDSGAMQTGTWIWQSGKFYYFGDDGRIVKANWLWYAGSWYYMDSTGAMVTGTYTVPGSGKCNFTDSGVWTGYAS